MIQDAIDFLNKPDWNLLIQNRRQCLQDIIANVSNPDERIRLYAELINIKDEELNKGKVEYRIVDGQTRLISKEVRFQRKWWSLYW